VRLSTPVNELVPVFSVAACRLLRGGDHSAHQPTPVAGHDDQCDLLAARDRGQPVAILHAIATAPGLSPDGLRTALAAVVGKA
jgi:hypothetical protein